MSKRILVTSGPTRAALDDVRFLTNRSTGRFGTLLAREALKRGCRVTFVYGIGSEIPPRHHRLQTISIETNEDLKAVLRHELKNRRYDAVIHAMAVLDFRPEKIGKGKRSSRAGRWSVTFVPTPKIISRIKKWSPDVFLVGFKLESGLLVPRLIRRGRMLLRDSGADLVVANQLPQGDDERHTGHLLLKGRSDSRKVTGKKQLAQKIISHILDISY